LGDDVARGDAQLDHVQHGGAGVETVAQLVVGHGGLCAAVGQAQAHGPDGAGHGVRRVHPAAGAFTRDGVLVDVPQLLVADEAVGVLAHGFEHGDDVAFPFLRAHTAGEDGAAVNEDAGAVEPGHGDHAAGHVLVAAADGDEAVHAFAAYDGLDGVGD